MAMRSMVRLLPRTDARMKIEEKANTEEMETTTTTITREIK